MTRRRLVALVGVGIAATFAIGSREAGAALCKNRRGALFVRDACKRKETTVTLPKGDPGPQGSSSLRIRALDATGKPIGHVNAYGDIVFATDGVAFFANATLDGFQRAGSLYFEATNCSGAPLVVSRTGLYARLVVLGGAAYRVGEPVGTRALMSSSSGSTADQCTGPGLVFDPIGATCCSTFTSALVDRAGPAIPFDIGAFTPPFQVEVER